MLKRIKINRPIATNESDDNWESEPCEHLVAYDFTRRSCDKQLKNDNVVKDDR